MASFAAYGATTLNENETALAQNVSVDGCFGWFHAAPDKVARRTAVVLCPGLKTDALRGHHGFRLLADALAEHGFHTLRFDYPGTGDSLDPPPGDLWDIWQQSIHRAADWLRYRTGARRIVLCGLRLGATLAAAVAADRTDVAALVLLAPVLRGRSYIRQLSIEAHAPGAVPRPGEDLVVQELRLSGETVGRISAVDLRQVTLPAGCQVALHAETPSPILAECAASWSQGGAVVMRADFAGLEPLLRPVFMSHEPPADVSRIVAWLEGVLPAGARPLPASYVSDKAALYPPGCVETPLRFGPQGRLFGVLCRPTGGNEADLAVVIGNSSGDPHYGFARVAVDLARRMANEGYASLRIDFAGLGDSPAPGDLPTHVFETDRRGDFSAAIDALAARGYRRFAVEGLCSGAYHAFHAALAEPRIGVLLLVNMPMFQWQNGVPIELMEHTMHSPMEFLQKLRRRDVWIKLLHERIDLAGRLATQGLWFARRANMVTQHVAERLGRRTRPSFAQESLRHIAPRTRTLFLMAAGDLGLAALAQAFGTHGVPAGTTLRVLPDIDHAVTMPEMQAVVAKNLIAFLKGDTLTGIMPPPQMPAPATAEMVHAP